MAVRWAAIQSLKSACFGLCFDIMCHYQDTLSTVLQPPGAERTSVEGCAPAGGRGTCPAQQRGGCMHQSRRPSMRSPCSLAGSRCLSHPLPHTRKHTTISEEEHIMIPILVHSSKLFAAAMQSEVTFFTFLGEFSTSQENGSILLQSMNPRKPKPRNCSQAWQAWHQYFWELKKPHRQICRSQPECSCSMSAGDCGCDPHIRLGATSW